MAFAVWIVTDEPVVMLVADQTLMSEFVQPFVTETFAAKLTDAVAEPVAAKVRFPQVPVVEMLLFTAMAALAGRTTSPAASAF